MNYPTNFTLNLARDANNHKVFQICAKSGDDGIHSVVAEIREWNICEEHGTADQWALVIASLIINASKDGTLTRVLGITKTELEKSPITKNIK